MDGAGQIGPEISGYDTDVLGIASALRAGAIHVNFTADGTRLGLLVTPADDVKFLSPSGRFDAGINNGAGWLHVASSNGCCAWLMPEARGAYIAKKLRIADADGEAVAGFLARVARASMLVAV